MSTLEGSASVVDETPLQEKDGSVTLTVSPYSGERGKQKGLKFTVVGIEITDKAQVYGICEALSAEKSIINVAVYSGRGDVCVTIHYWQEVIESLATRIAMLIGTSLGKEPDAIDVKINRLR